MSVTAVPIRPLKRGSVLKLWLALGLLVVAAAALAWSGTSGNRWITTESGLQYQVIKEGEGASPSQMDIAKFDYVGRLPSGTEFDSSKERGPAEIPVFGVVPGFAEGLQLMNKGASYRFRIPPEIGYGPQGSPPVIPPNTTIEFEVTLHDFRSLTAEEQQQLQMMEMMQRQQMEQMQGGQSEGN
jgi:FKBP-type peptidyl-prolyl cis-trans isomerase FkpA